MYEDLLRSPPYSVPAGRKSGLLLAELEAAFEHHYRGCAEYRRFCDRRGARPPLRISGPADLPYLPVGLFKRLRLASVPEDGIRAVLASSATTSQTPSRVVLDRATGLRQMKTLLWILADYLGPARRPWIVFDAEPPAGGGAGELPARLAALRGFLGAASTVTYCMRAGAEGALSLDAELLARSLRDLESRGERPVLFGFTYVLHAAVLEEMRRGGLSFRVPGATVLHIGGWKKLADRAVSRDAFRASVSEAFGLPPEAVLDTYGFTEQLGLVYPDDADGVKRCPLASEVIVRDPRTLEPAPDGAEGLLEFVTPLPLSYPGIAVLLDDIGAVVTREPGPTGRRGTGFVVRGRARESELRGCGDVIAEAVSR